MANAQAPLDPTFRNYDAEQAAAYARNRGVSSKIIQEVVDAHISRGGEFGMVLDVGCGTGKAAQHLAPLFERAAGVDPSREMILQVLADGGFTRRRYEDVLHALDRNGSLDYAMSVAQQHAERARCALGALADSEYKRALLWVPEFVVARDK